MKSDCEREREQQLGEPEGGKMRWQCLHISSFFTFSLSISFFFHTHPSFPVLHSAASQAEAPRSTLLTSSTLKVISNKLSTLKCRNIKLLYVTVAACCWGSLYESVCTQTVPLPVCFSAFVVENIQCKLSYIDINSVVFHFWELSWWSSALEEDISASLATYSLYPLLLLPSYCLCVCVCVFASMRMFCFSLPCLMDIKIRDKIILTVLISHVRHLVVAAQESNSRKKKIWLSDN